MQQVIGVNGLCIVSDDQFKLMIRRSFMKNYEPDQSCALSVEGRAAISLIRFCSPKLCSKIAYLFSEQ